MDNESKHTPGDWRILDTRGSFRAGWLCIVAEPSPNSRELAVIFDAGSAEDEENQANARLGAAAKDFYEAALELRHTARPLDLNATSRHRGPIVMSRDAYDSVMAALEKAES